MNTIKALADRINASWLRGRITSAERRELIGQLRPALVAQKSAELAPNPRPPSTHITAPARVAEPVAKAKAPDFNLPLLTPRERWERLILDEAERVMVASGTLSKAEAIMRVCTEHKDWYAKYQAASNDPKDRSAA